MTKQITFDRSLYVPEAVEAAVAAYAGHAQFEVTSTADTVVAAISGVVDDDPDTVAHAFCNHVLYETIARIRQSALREGE